jgi:AcrR family transcriptional regulator
MTRTIDESRRAELLQAVVTYLEREGVASLSLRPLAAELDTSARMLLHYFGSKEELVDRALAAARPDVAVLVHGIGSAAELRRAAQAMWRSITRGPQQPSMNVLIEVMGLAVTQPARFGAIARESVHAWVTPVRDVLIDLGRSRPDAEAVATALVSGMRGLALDAAVTREWSRVDRAADALIGGLLG